MGIEKKSNGAFIGSIVIIIILIIGGIYIWQSKVKSALEQKKVQLEKKNALEQKKIQLEQNVTPADTTKLNTLENDLNTLDTKINVDVNKVN